MGMPLIKNLVAQVYYGKVKNFESTSYDVRNIAPSCNAIYMHSLKAVHNSGYQCVECCNDFPPQILHCGVTFRKMTY